MEIGSLGYNFIMQKLDKKYIFGEHHIQSAKT